MTVKPCSALPAHLLGRVPALFRVTCVLPSCLSPMTWAAKALSVLPLVLTAIRSRDNVIDLFGWGGQSMVQTMSAQRVLRDALMPELTPLAVIGVITQREAFAGSLMSEARR